MTRVAVLGSTGMLGSMLAEVLATEGIEVVEFNRRGISQFNGNIVQACEVERNSQAIFSDLSRFKPDYIINAIGVIRQKICNRDPEAQNAIRIVNADFPSQLNEFQAQSGIPVIQIGTDCVFSGDKGNYSENANFDPQDIYGVTKVEGEKNSKLAMTIRTSIIGKEQSTRYSLLSWVLSSSPNSKVDGYINHQWNGVTTLAFSKIVSGVMKHKMFKSGVVHLVPRDTLSKYELINEIKHAFGREDLRVNKFEAERAIDMTLSTAYSEFNRQLWIAGGYDNIPMIKEMLIEYAAWSRRTQSR